MAAVVCSDGFCDTGRAEEKSDHVMARSRHDILLVNIQLLLLLLLPLLLLLLPLLRYYCYCYYLYY